MCLFICNGCLFACLHFLCLFIHFCLLWLNFVPVCLCLVAYTCLFRLFTCVCSFLFGMVVSVGVWLHVSICACLYIYVCLGLLLCLFACIWLHVSICCACLCISVSCGFLLYLFVSAWRWLITCTSLLCLFLRLLWQTVGFVFHAYLFGSCVYWFVTPVHVGQSLRTTQQANSLGQKLHSCVLTTSKDLIYSQRHITHLHLRDRSQHLVHKCCFILAVST